MLLRWMMAGALLSLGTACGLGTEGAFIDGRDLDLCADTIPACSGTAGCRLGPNNYLETRFPGAIQFLVSAPAEAVITVSIFFRETRATGSDHSIEFNEPGCFDQQVWRPRSDDLFKLANRDRILEVPQQVFLEGEHLVTVFSDSTSEVLLKADVETP